MSIKLKAVLSRVMIGSSTVMFTLERCVAKLLAHLLATAALWVRIQTCIKYTKWAKMQRSGQHTITRQKNIQKIFKLHFYSYVNLSRTFLFTSGIRER
jgi:hypothetical protein